MQGKGEWMCEKPREREMNVHKTRERVYEGHCWMSQAGQRKRTNSIIANFCNQ
jgi:hypothetical protein